MAEEFNDLNDILKQWAESGPKESDQPDVHVDKHVDITVFLANGSRQLFEDAHIQDLGYRLIVSYNGDITVFTEAAVLFYEIETIEVEDEA